MDDEKVHCMHNHNALKRVKQKEGRKSWSMDKRAMIFINMAQYHHYQTKVNTKVVTLTLCLGAQVFCKMFEMGLWGGWSKNENAF